MKLRQHAAPLLVLSMLALGCTTQRYRASSELNRVYGVKELYQDRCVDVPPPAPEWCVEAFGKLEYIRLKAEPRLEDAIKRGGSVTPQLSALKKARRAAKRSIK